MTKLTPMMKQYMEIKNNYKDSILLFRLGDFYEMFLEDAITASRELEITLTARAGGDKEKIPMCGIPHHASEGYIAKLVSKGYKVAICEQTQDPSETKGIVRREVVRVITAGTVISPNMLNEKENNYIMSIFADEKNCGISYADISTGELNSSQITGPSYETALLNQLAKVKPKEIILNSNIEDENLFLNINKATESYISQIDNRFFDIASSTKLIKNHFNVQALKGLGLDEKIEALRATGGLLSHLSETQMNSLAHISKVFVYEIEDKMSLDKATLKNLELTETTHEKSVKGSLLGTLDKTVTAMGGRKIKQWIKEPLNKFEDINKRLDAVENLFDNIISRNNIRESLKNVYDLERLAGRISYKSANAKDLIALKNSLEIIPDIKSELEDADNVYIRELNDNLDPMYEICNVIEASITDDPPFTLKEGSIIKRNVSAELDELKDNISGGQQWIAGLESIEKEKTGIKSLKVGFNKIFGYYIEVTKSYYDLVPDNYIRKQTLANCERFITPELKEVESKVLSAESKINQLEYEIFCQIRDDIQLSMSRALESAQILSILDVLTSFAEVSEKQNYVKPAINNGDLLKITNGRHPVIENTIENGIFVPNNTYVDSNGNSFLLITGPNMAGKSTYMRQTALIVLMAQIGCFVPATDAQIGIVDRIFTRIGASDNLAQGQSTFLVEMSELAYILNNATSKSLVILDEIGRGTSTYDGLSIAWAAVEYLCKENESIKTLFATHYHELTELEGALKGVKNLNVDVKEDDEDVIFLHKIIDGRANQSYGIQVAKLAGIPEELLLNATSKLIHLEDKGSDINMQQESHYVKEDETQMSLFDASSNKLFSKIRKINLLDTTPMQALGILEELITEVRTSGDANE